jgi:hypothetical protein
LAGDPALCNGFVGVLGRDPSQSRGSGSRPCKDVRPRWAVHSAGDEVLEKRP